MPESLTQIWSGFTQAQEVAGWLAEIYNQKAFGSLLAYEFVWLIAIWSLRPWVLAKAQGWGGRLFAQAWMAFLYWPVALWAIPGVVWGDPFRNLFSYGLKALFKMILA